MARVKDVCGPDFRIIPRWNLRRLYMRLQIESLQVEKFLATGGVLKSYWPRCRLFAGAVPTVPPESYQDAQRMN
jgi:hypothetical protein